jgi:hypothetical protein
MPDDCAIDPLSRLFVNAIRSNPDVLPILMSGRGSNARLTAARTPDAGEPLRSATLANGLAGHRYDLDAMRHHRRRPLIVRAVPPVQWLPKRHDRTRRPPLYRGR